MDKKFTKLIKNNIWKTLVFLLIMSPVVSFSQATTITVTGTVKDVSGEVMPGVGIKVKDGTTTAMTDGNGKFSIKIPDQKARLQFSYIGYNSYEELVGDRKVLTIVLKENVGSLTEVVVQGYGGSSKKSDLTGATVSINSAQIAERQPTNIYDAIQGQASGVLVINDNGEPGAEGNIQIRGASTFSSSGNNPLYVVDGVITDGIANINPNDIQNIEILKDAASTSIYGSRAANGVILVTTKRGQVGKPRVDVSYGRKIGNIAHTIQQANSKDLRLWRGIQNNNTTSGSSTDSLNVAYNADNYLEDLLLGNTAILNDVKLGVSGGQKGLTYYSSLNYLDDKGSVLNTWAKRLQGRMNIDFQVSPKLRNNTNVTFNWNKKSTWSTGGSLNPVFDRPNNLRLYLPDGTLTSYTSSKRNPVANALLETNITDGYGAAITNNLEYQIYKDLKFTTVASGSLNNNNNKYFQPEFLDDNGNENRGSQSSSIGFNWTLQSFFNFDKTIGKDHKFNATLGVESSKNSSRSLKLQALPGSFVNELITNFNLANIDIRNSNSGGGGNTLASLLARVGYNYKGRYILNSTFRRDGSSKFGPENKWGNFLSGSMAWRVSDEKFMAWAKKGKVLNDAKIRVSIGAQGNNGIGDNEDATLVSFGDVSYLGDAGAVISNRLGNPEIQWENTVQTNLGTDISLFGGRLLLVADYYHKATNKLLMDNLLPKETGFQTVRVNAGDLYTNGAEFSISGTPVAKSNFTWFVNANISFEQGRVKSLFRDEPFITGTRYLISPGGRLGDFYGYKQLGIYRWTASNAYSADWSKLEPVNVAADGQSAEYYTLNGQRYTGTVQKLSGPAGFLKGGDTEWLDVNKDGLIDDADRSIIGNATPDFYLGLSNTFSYKRFSLNVMLNATIGGQIYNAFKESFSTFGSSNGTAFPEAIYGAWRKEGDIAIYPYFPTKDNNGNQKRGVNSYYLEDASFLRLSSARVNYSFQPALINKFKLKALSLFVYGTNLLTWTNYSGFDPEFSDSNPLSPGTDGGKYPKRREFGFGINISL